MLDIYKLYEKELGALYARHGYSESGLSFNESVRLVILARQGDALARNKLVESCLKLVLSVAARYKYVLNNNRLLTWEDLIQFGNEGLCKAVETYDLKKETKFSVHAFILIKGYILNNLAKYGYAVGIPANLSQDNVRFKKKLNDLGGRLGREPSLEELSLFCGCSVDYLIKVIIYGTFGVIYLNDAVGYRFDNLSYLDVLPSPQALPYQQCQTDYDYEVLRKYLFYCLDGLNNRERLVIIDYFGLEGEAKTLEQLGDECGFNRETMRITKDKVLKKLRKKFKSKELKENYLGIRL